MTEPTAPQPSLVRYEIAEPGIARLTLNRADKRNAQNVQMLLDLDAAFDEALRDDAVHCIILDAAGRDFSAGHDLSGSRESTLELLKQRIPKGDWAGYREPGAHGYYAIEKEIYLHYTKRWRNLAKPTIAVVQGNCIGGGLMLAWACDIILAAEDAKFSDPVVTFGMLGVEWFAHPWELGARKAKEHLFTSDSWTAQEAWRLGMVNHVAPAGDLPGMALAMARKIAAKPPFGVRLAKEAVNRCTDMPNQTMAIESVFGLHHLNHQHNFLQFGTLMDMSRTIMAKDGQRKG